MTTAYFLCRSVTHAQKIDRLLKFNYIQSSIERPERNITQSSCVYAVAVSDVFLGEAIEVLKRKNVLPVKLIISETGKPAREVFI